jgi:hypothetical protein
MQANYGSGDKTEVWMINLIHKRNALRGIIIWKFRMIKLRDFWVI